MTVTDVWVCEVRTLPAYRDLLSSGERDQASRFRFDADRDAYVAAHGLARLALSTRVSRAPHDWRFRRMPQGRPELADDSTLRFNISHTRRVVACVVTDGDDCGVDVEHTDSRADVELLTRGVLTASERAGLDGSRAAFFRHWTLKEAYAKARGLGVALPFDSYGFTIDGDDIRLTGPDDDGSGWRFTQWHHDPVTLAAVAVRNPAATVTVHTEPPAP